MDEVFRACQWEKMGEWSGSACPRRTRRQGIDIDDGAGKQSRSIHKLVKTR
jgi:hypothetical protein